jgi:hypothetical protein
MGRKKLHFGTQSSEYDLVLPRTSVPTKASFIFSTFAPLLPTDQSPDSNILPHSAHIYKIRPITSSHLSRRAAEQLRIMVRLRTVAFLAPVW